MSSSKPGARNGRFYIVGLRGARGCPPRRPNKTRAKSPLPEARGKTRPNEEPHKTGPQSSRDSSTSTTN